MYSIGRVSGMFQLPVSARRHDDRQGLFPDPKRRSAIRRFSSREIETLRAFECLKTSGPGMKDVRHSWPGQRQAPADGNENRISAMPHDRLPPQIQALSDRILK